MHKRVIAILCLVAVASSSVAQIPSISARVNERNPVVGDHIIYTLQVSYDPEIYSIGMPTITSELLQPFVVLDAEKADSVRNRHELIITKAYTISCYDSGLYYLPIPALNILHEGTAERISSDSGSIRIAVANVAVDANGDIKEIKEATLNKSAQWLNTQNVLIAALSIIATFLIVLWYLKKQRGAKQENIYKRTMDTLVQLELAKDINAREFYILLSDTLKKYLGERFMIPVQTQVTADAVHTMAQTKIVSTICDTAAEILNTADEVKFAYKTIGRTTMMTHVLAAKKGIQDLEDAKIEELRKELEAIKVRKKGGQHK
jgi:hypothetical protein